MTLLDLEGCVYMASGYVRTRAGAVVHVTEILSLINDVSPLLRWEQARQSQEIP